jgi:hypothetical protein
MILFNFDEKTLYDIAERVGVQLVIVRNGSELVADGESFPENVGDKPEYVAEPWTIGGDVIFGSKDWFENIDPESY